MDKIRVFLSYKSQDSNLVRFVAAWLRHNGIECWFAEENVPLEGQEDHRTIIQKIVDGITNATHVLIVSNHLYATAPWCQIEFDLLLACGLLTRATAAEVQLLSSPPVPKHDAIVAAMWEDSIGVRIPSIGISDNELPDLKVLHDFLAKECQWPLPSEVLGFVVEDTDACVPIQLPVFGLSLALPGWSPDLMGQFYQGGDFEMAQGFTKDLEGKIHLDIRSHRFANARSPFSVSRPVDDLEQRRDAYAMANYFRSNLPKWLSRRTTIDGIHLVFIGKRSHFGMTYTISDPWIGTSACRKYVLGGWDPESSFHYEIVLTFNTFGSLSRLRALSPLFEAIVYSARFSHSAMQTFRMVNGVSRDGSTASDSAQSHPLSSTFDEKLSSFFHPSGHFDSVPSEESDRFSIRRSIHRLLRPDKARIVFSEAGGWHRYSSFAKNEEAKS